MTFEHGVGPRLRIHRVRKFPGGRPRAGQRSSVGWGLSLGPAWKGRGCPSKGGPLECGVREFGGAALSEGVWVGFRPSALEGVSECRGRALGGGVEVGLWFCGAGGRLQGQRFRPRSPTGFPVPMWTGKALAPFPSIPSRSSPTISPRVSPVTTEPQTVGGSCWV